VLLAVKLSQIKSLSDLYFLKSVYDESGGASRSPQSSGGPSNRKIKIYE